MLRRVAQKVVEWSLVPCHENGQACARLQSRLAPFMHCYFSIIEVPGDRDRPSFNLVVRPLAVTKCSNSRQTLF